MLFPRAFFERVAGCRLKVAGCGCLRVRDAAQGVRFGSACNLQLATCNALTAGIVLLFAARTWTAPITNVIPDLAHPLPLSAVRLTGGPLKHAQDLDAEYLLKLEPDRMMAGYRLRAGLKPKAEGYGGWDSPNGKQLTGHIAGHYLSAASLMFAATGDPRFKERVDYLVKEMKDVQAKRSNGYLGAITDPQGTDGEQIFEQVAQGKIRSGGFDLNGMWSPWYTLHKTYAGLRDAYRYTGNQTALDLEIKFAAWAEGILSKLNDEQLQKMLNTEFGGMPEVLADLYADTGDKKWLDLSHRFDHRAVLDPLSRHEDRLAGLHGNTQVPKLYGSLARYIYTGESKDGEAAKFFWEEVAHHHSFATGGHGKDEYFGPPDKLSDRIDGRTAESCNVYNMLKYTRRLFAIEPRIEYADFLERALFNHVLASMDPQDGRTCYMVPVGRGVQHEYQDMYRGFTCCVGSGMESHALHSDGIYYESGDKLWVNLYTPSTVDWKSAGVKVTVETDFPEGQSASVRIMSESPRPLTLALRRPSWADDRFELKMNGEPARDIQKTGSYVELKRTWKTGDTVALTLPKKLGLEPLPDNPRRVAILWGPLVLAGDLGAETERRRSRNGAATQPKVPVFVTNNRPVEDWLKPVAGQPGRFRTEGVGRETDVEFQPFYTLHRRTYGIYWDVFTPEQWAGQQAEYAAEQERQRKLEVATVAYAQPGEMQPERDYNYQGPEDAGVERVLGRAGRRGRSWFSFELPVETNHPMALVVTYHSGERRRRATFEILVNGQRVAAEEVKPASPPKFYDVEYRLAADLVKDQPKVTVRFQATDGNEIATVFGLRMIRTDAMH